MDNEKQQRSPEPFSSLSNNLVAKESKDGKEEFSRVAEDEKKRVQQVVEKENERILQEMRENGTIQICPICLDEIPAIQNSRERKRRENAMIMMCCGVTHCNNCTGKTIADMYLGHGKSRNDRTKPRCYSCREPAQDATYYANTIKPNDKRHWLLHATANCYMVGIHGLKKDIKKAFELFERAADLGNVSALEELALMYFHGHIVATKCLDKARYYAEKAANQGAPEGQYILASLLLLPDKENYERNEEAFRLFTLAAFQGSAESRLLNGSIYEKRYQVMITEEGDAWRKNFLLSLYWYAKGAELEVKNNPKRENFQSLAAMAFQLNIAMSLLWHRRDYSNRFPLLGYSHLAFYTWALTKGGKHPSNINLPEPFMMYNDAWKNTCANCGNKSRVKQEFKACARCKTCHYCSKKCQVEHWKAGHKVDCKGHWIEEFFPDIRKARE